MFEVEIQPIQLDRLVGLLTDQRGRRLQEEAERARVLLTDRVVWNVNATAQGGGVAEMLQALLAYTLAAGIDTRWLVLSANAEFFTITKRLHNVLHGSAGDGGPLGEDERARYEQELRPNIEDLAARVSPGDVVLLHDPQTAGMVDAIRARGARVVWRCHIGRDTPNEQTEVGWAFLRPYIENAAAVIFSREAYAPGWISRDRLSVIPPSIDPFSPKNRPLEPAAVRAALTRAHLVDGPDQPDDRTFVRRDGSTGGVRALSGLVFGDVVPPLDAQLVVQVSRWDRLKDMTGVLTGFVGAIDSLPDDTHLMLVGPDVSGVSDDPEGAEVLAECQDQWRALPEAVRRRVHLTCLPMDDVDENAHLVNALQHHAAVVVQKSLVEGFGLTVTEAMWKARPLIASAVGGIQDQIVDGRDGLLLADPNDLSAFGDALDRILHDSELATRLGHEAKVRVQDQFLGDRHLIQYVDLFDALVS